jgi:hypothetical protein
MDQIPNLLNQYSEGDELEIRVGYYKTFRFVPSISKWVFNKLVRIYTTAPEYHMQRKGMEIYYLPDGIRQRIYNDGTVETIKKERKGIVNLHKEGIRIALSSEKPAQRVKKTPQKALDRIRYTFVHRSGLFKLDISRDELASGRIEYQYEAEFIRKPSYNEVMGLLNFLKNQVATFRHEHFIIQQLNQYFSREIRRRRLDKNTPFVQFIKPISIKRYNIPFLHEYVVLNKMDGIGYILFFSKAGAYYINNADISSYLKVSPPDLVGTIILGEYMPKYKNFSAFDTLFFRNRDVRSENLLTRYGYLDSVSGILKHPSFIVKKLFYKSSLEKNITEAFKYADKKFDKEDTDGLVFSPLNKPYYSKLHYKWKPIELSTIDFVPVQTSNNEYMLYVYGPGPDKPLLLFQGSKTFPFSGRTSLTRQEVAQVTDKDRLDPTTVVEFQFRNGKFIPYRLRSDKINPNFIKVAESIWDDINNPIAKDELIELSKYTIDPTEDVNKVAETVCSYLTVSRDPEIFSRLTQYINNSIVTDSYKKGSYLGYRKNMGNKLVGILYNYFW